jgi:hypothetical protein
VRASFQTCWASELLDAMNAARETKMKWNLMEESYLPTELEQLQTIPGTERA